ncbi:MAG: metalloregulator ArsR/SmtB family transcription factor [Bacteroidetes bacterium]|jgi:DNA-binding transcriptional ArsR family regulator|nr:metalloregulator ArsR/SmtB family transcription factor [Bacteroidota bacterium]MBU1579590.1 metalloregulator ArsR/SmtB family transcription factor [Bacteroidota bacterium]MBU2558738.1 metalloregulator ArsR/SmtB family transcription factor [Bacteroidota bacterium]MDA3944800.1 metalloregulator ArsR/SmtB family transcription factor [Bacteroidota bacterium]
METLEITEQSIQKLEKVAGRLRAIAHPVRLAIIEMLSLTPKMSVTEIYLKLDIEQAAASHHLNIMKNKGVLEAKRDGKKIYYSLQNTILSDIITCINQCKDC